ncbi:MAG: 7-cyano-7-deazaguanine synthase QueC [Elusimicrobia bacterium]|nr:7-cyano-7-deazaguanine synthase QueC [Elusimicrobiota bacterium]
MEWIKAGKNKKKAVVLLSGGLDSSTTLYLAKSRGWDVHCLIFSYGQRHSREVKSAVSIAKKTRSSYSLVNINLPWCGSSLIDKSKKIPPGKIGRERIPSTYVPGRNTIFLSYAFSFCEAKKIPAIFIGANAVDFSGYPDCRPCYYRAFNRLLEHASVAGVKIVTPLIRKSKRDIVLLGHKLGVPFEMTWSCYRGGDKPCGDCDSCRLRAKGFEDAGLADPLVKTDSE